MDELMLLPTGAASVGKPLASETTSASTSSSSSPTQPPPPSPSTPSSTPAHSPSALKNRQVEPLRPEADENTQTQPRAGPESLAARRQSFTAMAADSRANLRRRSCDLTAGASHRALAGSGSAGGSPTGGSLTGGSPLTDGSPSRGSPSGVAGVSAALRTMGMAAGSLPDNKGHLQHLRVYGRTNPTAGGSAVAVTASPTLAPAAGGPIVAAARLAAPAVRQSHVQGEPLVAVVAPATDAVWTRGRPVTIEWKVLDASVSALAIELLEDGSSATTVIAREAPNSGAFVYHRVPWGMASGSKYFLKVSPADVAATRTTSVSMATTATAAAMVSSSARYTTTGFFTISSAP